MFRAQIGEPKIWESMKQKLLGGEMDRTLSFDKYVVSLCRKDGKNCRFRLSNFMSSNKSRVLMKAHFELQFGYCP